MTFSHDTTCDILIVGGGGAGGGRQGAGGGGGGVMYLTNQTITAGSHTITVGKGGVAASTDTLGGAGFSSSFDSFTAYGGGTGAGFSINVPDYNASTYIIASGGGGRGWGTSASDDGWYNGGLGNGNTSDLTLNGGVGNNGGRGYQDLTGSESGSGGIETGLLGGGGGGAGAVGGDATPNSQTSPTYTGKAGDGGVGIEINIKGGTGNYYGGGGGGGSYSVSSDIVGAGGLGGGGGGRNNAAGTAGAANTGGGGGGGGYANETGGNGGSGIFIKLHYIFKLNDNTWKLCYIFNPHYYIRKLCNFNKSN
ncbi:hypothetical protein GUITHDRAFT_148023 [Guillardia theta CCMP2712]|uniref:Glycine-rich domain-containing protein n=1 Tax=Guillardia theta (strain CCMP2712) TaxID=905079 RepID=L1IB30_GUITC|nr:hypothetical protein GUITHDRAFT_148023 [Guillardia theta CCMP2712]EKX33267.1 hypothetical protein GUITHDRAFT_148023 [Guillardia theta CCMP2712]|eukprot:XP_005820247.1 hypothetical protein GUITHDRAFT_148023 [Guillardia theta CCMP2712]